MMDVSVVLSRLEKVSGKGDGKWLARCPAHDDRSPSLAIKEVDGKTLLHCFAGCSVHDIVGVLELELSDLMPDNPAYKKGSNPLRLNKYELFDLLFFEAIVLYLATKQMLN
ncbi:MAG TPA: DNA primase, partial [Rhodospirillales bacterium]|nr:DNA primase [Rhodospirillales bacterium]